jgi:hypothetical protein
MPRRIFESGQSNRWGSWLLSAAAASEHDLMQGHRRKEIAAVEQLYGDFSGAPTSQLRPVRQKLHYITDLICAISSRESAAVFDELSCSHSDASRVKIPHCEFTPR